MKRLLYFSFLTVGMILSPAAFGQPDFLGIEEENSSVAVQETEPAPEETGASEQNTRQENTLTAAATVATAEITADKTPAAPDTGKTEKSADVNAASEDFIDEYISDIETEKEAKSTARKLLEQKPVILKLRQNELKSLEEAEKLRNKKQTETTPEKPAQAAANIQTSADNIQTTPENEENKAEEVTNTDNKTAENELPQPEKQLQPAPLGLFWGAGISEIQALGFELKPAERKDYKNVYIVLNGKQKNQTFRLISAIFGDNDSLWCIYAESRLLDDTPEAAKVLELYHKYYTALEKKYGNAQEFFTPYREEELLITGTSAPSAETEDHKPAQPASHEIGNSNFLKELQEGKAVLYATFGDDNIGATLGVSVDGDLKSYISLDYKNYALQKKEQDAAFDSILNEL